MSSVACVPAWEQRFPLKHGKKGGTVTIYYYSDEELDSLLDKLT